MAIYVGRWDCNYCGNIGNLGPHTHCSECGAARPENVVFYMPRNINSEVTDKEQLTEAKAGANWLCGFCNNSNRNTYKACVSCGASKEDAESYLETKEFYEDAVPYSSQLEQLSTPPVPTKKRSKLAKFFLYFILAGLTLFGLSRLSTSVDVTVSQMEWERVIRVEVYKNVTEKDWSLPAGGKLISKAQKVHHYERRVTGYQTKTRTVKEAVGTEEYVCGKRDLGNGYFEDKYCTRTIYEDRTEEYEEPIYEKFPVYKTEYTYEIYRWKPFENYKSSGYTKEVYWSTLPDIVKNNADKYKTQAKEAAYYFQIKDHKGNIHWYQTDYEYWKNKVFLRKKIKAKKSTVFGYFKGLADESKVKKHSR